MAAVAAAPAAAPAGSTIAAAGLTVVTTLTGSRAGHKAAQEQARQMQYAAWGSYDAYSTSLRQSRESAEEFYVKDLATARAKLGASGIRPGSAEWQRVENDARLLYETEIGKLDAIDAEFRESNEYRLAMKEYEEQTSVTAISAEYGLQPIGNVQREAMAEEIFTYEDYDFSDPTIPGYDAGAFGETNVRLSMDRQGTSLERYSREDEYGNVTTQATYVSQGFYDIARPTMDEYYAIHYSGDKEAAEEAQAAIDARREEYIMKYGSPIAGVPTTEYSKG